jgi:hypothetical protein
MSTTKSSPFISPSLIDSVWTNVDVTTPTSRGDSPETANREGWQRLIDYQLIEWGWNTDQFEDEGIEPPTRDTVQLAIDVAEKLRDAGLSSPNSVVPDVNGGIVFERREKDVIEVFHVWDDGTIEYQCFHGTRLIERRPL